MSEVRLLIAKCLLIVGVVVPTRLSAQPTQIDTAVIRRYVAQEVRADRVAGLAIAVVSRDRVEFAAGFGTTGRDGERVTPDTPFLLGSMSKSVGRITGAVRELVFAVLLLFGAPWLLGFGWGEILRQMPDVGGWMLLSIVIGTATGLVRLRGIQMGRG